MDVQIDLFFSYNFQNTRLRPHKNRLRLYRQTKKLMFTLEMKAITAMSNKLSLSDAGAIHESGSSPRASNLNVNCSKEVQDKRYLSLPGHNNGPMNIPSTGHKCAMISSKSPSPSPLPRSRENLNGKENCINPDYKQDAIDSNKPIITKRIDDRPIKKPPMPLPRPEEPALVPAPTLKPTPAPRTAPVPPKKSVSIASTSMVIIIT